MRLPGFTAESSLGGARTQYGSATNGLRSHADAGVISQQVPWVIFRRCPVGCFPTGKLWPPCWCLSVSDQILVEGPVNVSPGWPVEGPLGL
jgi:hypothetical protein